MKTARLGLCALSFACGGVIVGTPPDVPGQPPPLPVDAAPASGVTEAFELDALSLGEAWRSLGYDLDHLTTTKDSTNVCTRAAGAPEENQVDGDHGIDNAWGSTVLPILQTVMSMPAPSQNASSALATATTLDLAVTGLPADPSASALGLKMVTSFAKSATHFDSGYVNHGTFVSGAGDSPIMLAVPFVVNDATVVLPLAIHDAVVTFSASTSDEIAGTIAGVLDVAELTLPVLAFAKEVDASYFEGNQKALDALAHEIVQAADILLDGTNASGAPCSAISIGLGFTAHRTAQ